MKIYSDTCIYDASEECCHECYNCPQADTCDPDWDLMRDTYNEMEVEKNAEF